MIARLHRLPVVLAVTMMVVLGALPASANERTGAGGPPDGYIVVFRDGAVDVEQLTRRLEAARGFRAVHTFRTLKGFSARLTAAQAALLRADPNVAMVSEDQPVHALNGFPMTPGDSAPTGVRRIGAAAGGYVRDPSGASVAVIDSGIDLAHPDLNAVHGINCVRSGPANDDNGHGTHVAGTIGARNNGAGVVGVAPGTRVISVKVLNAFGQGTWSQVICGIDWIASTLTDADPGNDVRVANMSLGGGGSPVKACSTTTDALHKAICRATAAGVTVVVAAGNDGHAFDAPLTLGLPAAYPEVLTVTAMTDGNGQPGGGPLACGEVDDQYASFSNWASTNGGDAHTIAAPGTCIRSTALGGGTTVMSGTSMASPHVAAAIALCLDSAGTPGPCAGLNPAQIIAKMRTDAANKSAADQGYGFVGDPLRSIGRHYGHLLHVGVEPPPGPSDPGGAGAVPVVTNVTPATGASGQPASTAVGVTFSEQVNRVVTQAAFSLVGASGSAVSGSFAWAGNTMTFKPSTPLMEGTTYTAKVGATARSTSGTPVAGPFSWTFRTVARSNLSPTGVVVEARSVRAGGYKRLATNNRAFFDVNSTTTKTFTTSWYARFSNVPRNAISLDVSYAGKNTRACSQVIQAWSWTSSRWVQLDARTVGTTKVRINSTLPGQLAQYVNGSGATGEARVRVRCTTSVGSFYARGDYMSLSYSRP
jgi:subtilisin family serine protease